MVQIQKKKIWHLDLIISFEKYSKVKAQLSKDTQARMDDFHVKPREPRKTSVLAFLSKSRKKAM